MSLTTTKFGLSSSATTDEWALRVLKELEQAAIVYCVLRGGDQLRQPSDNEEVDLLVAPEQMRQVCIVLSRQGFVQLKVWGHAPHHFFVSYDEATDRWLKLDVVTRVAYGRPSHALSTNLATGCLRNRRSVGGVFIPSPEDEWVTLLLHCVLDKGSFPQIWRRRLTELCEQIGDEDYASELLEQHWSPKTTARILRTELQTESWETLLAARPSVERRLATNNIAGTMASKMRDPLLRKLNRLARLMHPQALSVAILAPDGAGKSTLANGIRNHFFFPVEQIYMGLYQQRRGFETGRRWPGFGLVGKVLTQWRRYWKAHVHKARGRFVIFDRYTYDALLPSKHRLTRWQRLRRWLLANACPAPDLIVVLDAPGKQLFARKGEHSPEYLEQHRQAYLSLTHRFPQLIVVDATRDAEHVRCDVTTRLWREFADRMNCQ